MWSDFKLIDQQEDTKFAFLWLLLRDNEQILETLLDPGSIFNLSSGTYCPSVECWECKVSLLSSKSSPCPDLVVILFPPGRALLGQVSCELHSGYYLLSILQLVGE
jgi:hypothetical protein